MALRGRFEAEDEARAGAMQSGYRTGTEVELPVVTPPDERQAALAEAEARLTAAHAAFYDFLREALDELTANESLLHRRVDERARSTQAKREEARRLLKEAEAEVGNLERLRTWVERAASGNSGWQISWDLLQPTFTEEETEWTKGFVREHGEQEALSHAH